MFPASSQNRTGCQWEEAEVPYPEIICLFLSLILKKIARLYDLELSGDRMGNVRGYESGSDCEIVK